MRLHKAFAGGLAAALALAGLSASGDAPEEKRQPAAPPVTAPAPDEPVFGWQLMTNEEMAAHHARMRAATTPEEREKIRQEHHQQMVERAKQRGVTLPAQPLGPPPGRGMGPGMGRRMGPPGGTGEEPSAP
jgi:hypothetical protein